MQIQPLIFVKRILLSKIKPHIAITLPMGQAMLQMPTCLYDSSGTLLETTLVIPLANVASLVFRVSSMRASIKKIGFRMCSNQVGCVAVGLCMLVGRRVVRNLA